MPLPTKGPVIVEFPLRGEWRALRTPAKQVPSHGTDYFGQRYAFDFVQTAGDRVRFQPHGIMRHITVGVPASRFYCWGQPVYAAFEGNVVAAGDNCADRRYVSALWELARATLLPPSLRGSDYRPLTGNHVFVEGEPGVGVYAHLQRGSVCVMPGQRVSAGEAVGKVGNSGNSTMPHLHFHVMDGSDPFTAKGVACAFAGYERFVDGSWTRVDRGIPDALERIRYLNS